MRSKKSSAVSPPPPPTRKPARRLSLKAAMAAALRPRDEAKMKPLMNPVDEFPSLKSCEIQDMEALLLELQADIVTREELLSENEERLRLRELEMNEREALLEARKQVVEASHKKNVNTASPFSSEERKAFEALKREVENQAESLKEGRDMLHEREVYIEACENELVEKSMLLTEREARVEQREEDFEAKCSRRPPISVE